MRTTIISVRIRDGSYLSAAINSLSEEGLDIHASEFDYGDIDSRPEVLTSLLDTLDDTDFLFLWVSGNLEYFKNSRMVLKKAKSRSIPVFVYNLNREEADRYRDLFPYSDDDYEMVYRYSLMGGPANMRGVGIWIARAFLGSDVPLPEPEMPPAQGVYVPGCDDTSFETHIP